MNLRSVRVTSNITNSNTQKLVAGMGEKLSFSKKVNFYSRIKLSSLSKNTEVSMVLIYLIWVLNILSLLQKQIFSFAKFTNIVIKEFEFKFNIFICCCFSKQTY